MQVCSSANESIAVGLCDDLCILKYVFFIYIVSTLTRRLNNRIDGTVFPRHSCDVDILMRG